MRDASKPSRHYLDHAAASPVRPEVREAMLPWLGAAGNPSSLHAEGRAARAAIDEARETISDALECEFAELVFTSGGTEAASLAVLGSLLARAAPCRVLFGATEHPSVWDTQALVRRLGFESEIIPVFESGVADLDFLRDNLEGTGLVALMDANSETGTLQPTQEAFELCRAAGVPLFVDACQSFGKRPLPRADLVAVSAQKIGGPQGVGALAARVPVQALSIGGGQERDRRGGTENTAGIVGFGRAVALVSPEDGAAEANLFRKELHRLAPEGLVWTGGPALSSIVHCRFEGIRSETLLVLLDRLGVSASAGSACSAGSVDPSHVLRAMGWTEAAAWEAVRFSFGWRDEGAEQAAQIVADAVNSIRQGRR